MAKLQQHINQWKHNRAFLATISPNYPDWLVTVSFYVALHAIDALLVHDQTERVCSHESRMLMLSGTNRYAQIYKAFDPLYSLSRTVRYMARPEKWVPSELVHEQVIKQRLYPIERSVVKLGGFEVLPPIDLAI